MLTTLILPVFNPIHHTALGIEAEILLPQAELTERGKGSKRLKRIARRRFF